MSPARTGATKPRYQRLDRGAALAYYVGLGPDKRNLTRVAEKFGCSHATVRKWAKREDWPQIAAEADRKLGAATLRKVERTREERALQVARLRDLAADRLEDKIVAENGNGLDDSTVVQVWKEADRQYRLDIGEVTDRISIPEVREFVARFVNSYDEMIVAVLTETLENGKSGVVLRAIRDRTPAVLEQAAIEAPA